MRIIKEYESYQAIRTEEFGSQTSTNVCTVLNKQKATSYPFSAKLSVVSETCSRIFCVICSLKGLGKQNT
ncbi:uncharacterized protein Gasu_16630 [Galdieria sulphuraria]|uniref:Uncharacterized protein n=1 Tax=Galdieria sulphuraria TaxID=130081 RepID=M2X413_GALSU|nr:uncharacterized protein Gasu_16630 [Galdieria sulphuraria]EME31170.1 hypothetical protein Gasu_16630 [Galdieria sulphuraria]|eukprot:XP_005707690.1 hypothetical protein Gasu_16630 [Galdieria sulphuraria]